MIKPEEEARIGYQTAVALVSLVSQEIYSRYNAMLTANSIIIAVIGWSLTSGRSMPSFFVMLMPIAGLALCVLWFLFVNHGVYWQHLFRERAIMLEKDYFSETFSLISLVVTESRHYPNETKSQVPQLVRWFPFHRTSRLVIAVFFVIYVAMLSYAFALVLG